MTYNELLVENQNFHPLLGGHKKLLDHLSKEGPFVQNMPKQMAIGGKNYLFCGSHRAVQNASMPYSFFGNCKRQHINPREWPANTLNRIPDHSIRKLEKLLPGHQNNP
ncbi:transposase domain-containing protein [Gelidibacter salicanalis]|uniref:Transposase domain-containing protein n=1 Tax=Gelidibacter salicanalis TaxID=291193 RepID=A0A934KT13_9FLAO|nr:transposase domain-containing protein [Gelidibacter salicanalis]